MHEQTEADPARARLFAAAGGADHRDQVGTRKRDVSGEPVARGLDHQRRHRSRGASVVSGQVPAVVATAAVGDDILRHVLDDQIFAANAEGRLLVQLQRAGIPPHDGISSAFAKLRRARAGAEGVQAGTHRAIAGRFVVGPLQHRVLRLERRTPRSAGRGSP